MLHSGTLTCASPADANNHAFAHHVGIHVEDILLSSFTDPTPAFDSEKMSPIVNYGAPASPLPVLVREGACALTTS